MSKFSNTSSSAEALRIFPGFAHFIAEALNIEQEQIDEKLSEFAIKNLLLSDLIVAITGSSAKVEDTLSQLNAAYEDWVKVEINPQQLSTLMQSQSQSSLLLIDVREDWECKVASISGSVQLTQENHAEVLADAQKAQNVVLYCHHGVRSLYATSYFRENGIPEARSLQGGINAYSEVIDKSISQY